MKAGFDFKNGGIDMKKQLISKIGDWEILKHSHCSGNLSNVITKERIAFIKYDGRMIFSDRDIVPVEVINEVNAKF